MKKICVVSVSRADYGLLRWPILALQDSGRFEVQLVVAGGHFSKEQGSTFREVSADGIHINSRVPIVPVVTKPVEISAALGEGLRDFAIAFEKLKPDCILLLGDRSETLIAAIAAAIAAIPIAHIHGGELTLGALDDAFRHSITKMSHLHFVATEEYAQRVLQMGESPSRVFVTGFLGHESIGRAELVSEEKLAQDFEIPIGGQRVLVTVHPETISSETEKPTITAILSALEHFPEANVFFTAANLDSGGEEINRIIRSYCSDRDNAWFFESLGTRNYLSLMSSADCVLGNSSSGLIEAPALGIATIDVGHRQDGRVVFPSVTRVPNSAEEVITALEEVLSRDELTELTSPEFLGAKLPSEVISQVLANTDFGALRAKEFIDLD